MWNFESERTFDGKEWILGTEEEEIGEGGRWMEYLFMEAQVKIRFIWGFK